MIPCRLVTEEDMPHIEKGFNKLLDSYYKPWVASINPDECLRVIQQNGMIVANDFLVIISYEVPWYIGKKCLIEQMAARVYSTGSTFNDVCRFLEEEAIREDCAMIFTGSMFAKSDRAMERLYTNYGFNVSGRIMTYDVP